MYTVVKLFSGVTFSRHWYEHIDDDTNASIFTSSFGFILSRWFSIKIKEIRQKTEMVFQYTNQMRILRQIARITFKITKTDRLIIYVVFFLTLSLTLALPLSLSLSLWFFPI